MGKLALIVVLPLVGFAQDRGARVAEPAATSRKLALIIGNNDYRNQQSLRNSVNDASAMGDALRGLGFEITVRINLTMADMEKAALDFTRSVRPGDIALFYYSGHGMQVEQENYLLPVDFDAQTPTDAKYKAYAALRIQGNLRDAGASLQILILDACRDNPYVGLRGGGGGLAQMQAAKGSYIAFATAPGLTADDNASGQNGLFTSALLNALKQPGLTLDDVFNTVRREVSAARPSQVPWSSSSVVNTFYFMAPLTSNKAEANVDAASATWAVIRDSQNADDFEKFANAYPTSNLAPGARIRAEQLRRASTQLEAPPLFPPQISTDVRSGKPIGRWRFCLKDSGDCTGPVTTLNGNGVATTTLTTTGSPVAGKTFLGVGIGVPAPARGKWSLSGRSFRMEFPGNSLVGNSITGTWDGSNFRDLIFCDQLGQNGVCSRERPVYARQVN
jgi:hypothetical protein